MHCMCVTSQCSVNGKIRDNGCATADPRQHLDLRQCKQKQAVSHFWAERLNRLLFSLHDVRQGGIARLVQPEISCDDCWQPT